MFDLSIPFNFGISIYIFFFNIALKDVLPLSLWLLLPLWACGLKSRHSASVLFSVCCSNGLLCGCPPKYEIPRRNLDVIDYLFARYFHSECVLPAGTTIVQS